MTPAQLQTKLTELLALPQEAEWAEFKHNNTDPQMIGEYLSALSNAATLEGTVTHRIFLGSAAEYSIAIDGLGDMLVTAERQTQNDLVAPGERVAISFDPGTAHIFPA